MNKIPPKSTRTHKLASKLRENLRKRKAQTKARAATDDPALKQDRGAGEREPNKR